MKTQDFFSLLAQDDKNRRWPHLCHCVYAPLAETEFLHWKRDNPGIELPQDLLALYRMHNGFRIYADGPCAEVPDSQDGFPVFLPLREVRYAPRTMFGNDTSFDERIPRSWYALTRDKDSTYTLIYDVEKKLYYDFEPFEESAIGDSLEEALDWCAKFLKPL